MISKSPLANFVILQFHFADLRCAGENVVKCGVLLMLGSVATATCLRQNVDLLISGKASS